MVPDRRRELDRLRSRCRDLEARLDAFGVIANEHAIPTEYARALESLVALAYHGLTRPDPASGHGKADSRPPKHDPRAYALLEVERREMRRRAAVLVGSAEKNDGGVVGDLLGERGGLADAWRGE